ncbi:MAG: uridylate kinase [Methylomonas sp.]|jgi:aspartokinase-like uncharacterized kinase
MRIIKLGGSLLASDALPACLQRVAELSGRSLLTPGGGVFAEQVRMAQRAYAFDDVCAHRLAILAMQQMALVILALRPTFSRWAALDGACDWPGAAVWLPQPDELDKAGIPASWDITSDSLAAWLALQVAADELILVKSARIDPELSLAALQRRGIVDAAFHRFADGLACPVRIINKDDFISGE